MKICFFDSGMGGLTLLYETVKLLPKAEYLYFADILSCPLGAKTPQEIIEVLHAAMDFFLSRGSFDAMVLACNTATGYGIGTLRGDLPDVPFFGVEPAVKPAAERVREGNILVLCTNATAGQERFKALVSRHNERGNIISAPQPDLARIIEQNFPQNMGEIKRGINAALLPYADMDIRGVVLGCTHYIYARDFVAEALPGAEIFEGTAGTAKNIAAKMSGLPAAVPRIEIFNSANDALITKKYFEILKNMIE